MMEIILKFIISEKNHGYGFYKTKLSNKFFVSD